MVPTAAMSDAQHKQVGGMPWLKTGATHYYAQLGFSVKGRAIKGLVV